MNDHRKAYKQIELQTTRANGPEHAASLIRDRWIYLQEEGTKRCFVVESGRVKAALQVESGEAIWHACWEDEVVFVAAPEKAPEVALAAALDKFSAPAAVRVDLFVRRRFYTYKSTSGNWELVDSGENPCL